MSTPKAPRKRLSGVMNQEKRQKEGQILSSLPGTVNAVVESSAEPQCPDEHVAKKKRSMVSSSASLPAQQVSALVAYLDEPITPHIARQMRKITLDSTPSNKGTAASRSASEPTSNNGRNVCEVQPAASQPAPQISALNAPLNEPITPVSKVTVNISGLKMNDPLDTCMTPKIIQKRPATSQSDFARERNRIKNQRYREKQYASNPEFRKRRALSSQQSYRRKSNADRAARLAQMLRYVRGNQSKSKKTRQYRRLINRGLAAFNRLAALAPRNNENPFDTASIGRLCQRLRQMQPGKRYRHVVRKYIRQQQRQRVAAKLDALLNEIAKDISNPTFQKPEYAQLLLLGKKIATITSPADLTAHVNFIDEAFRKMRAMKEATTSVLGKTLAQLQRQITANVVRHPEINDDEYQRCQLYRLPYHVKQPSDSDHGFKCLEELYPAIYHETLTG
uniref:BZIP domain-containing protein n=1 Tax=Panagrellus redivivus TaxID=6233 RepID=A0A7E4ZVS5_PANRE